MEMLHAMEGVYTRLVRGLGLSYKCWLSNLTESGLISLCILQSSNILGAFEHVKNATYQLARGEMEFDAYALEGAKSSVIFDIADCENTREVAAAQSFINKVLRQSKRQKLDFFKAVQVSIFCYVGVYVYSPCVVYIGCYARGYYKYITQVHLTHL